MNTFLKGRIDNLNILVVEDNQQDYTVVEKAFGKLGKGVHLFRVQDGPEALDFLLRRGAFEDPGRSPLPDLILLDIMYPKINSDLNGIDTLSQIKANPSICQIPVVVLTGANKPEVFAKAYRFGAAGCFKKPLDFHEAVRQLELVVAYWSLAMKVSSDPR